MSANYNRARKRQNKRKIMVGLKLDRPIHTTKGKVTTKISMAQPDSNLALLAGAMLHRYLGRGRIR
jgi:hypothetical protein